MKVIGKLMAKAGAKSPVICLVGGCAAVVGGVLMAHRAGRKVEETLDINKEHLDNIRALKGVEEIEDEDGNKVPYTDKDYKKDLTKAYAGCAWDFAKLYLPPIALTAGGILCFVKGHKILGRRLASMTAAYECANEAFKKYRGNVVAFDGSDQDKRYLYGLEKEKGIEMEVVDPETGEVTTVKTNKSKPLDVIKDVSLVASPYAVKVEDCKGFTKDPEYNVRWLSIVQENCNLQLRTRGYLFLADVYDALGVTAFLRPEMVRTSHLVGWVIGEGDNEVIFDMVLVPEKCGMKDGETAVYREVGLVDFNCDGTIIDRL